MLAPEQRHPSTHHGGDHTSAWFATQYVHNHIPDIGAHDLIRLVASVGAETKGKYTYQSLVNATSNYQHDKSYPSVKNWTAHVPDVIKAAVRHGHKSWVQGFSYTSKDIPGSGGPSNIQKGAIAVGNGVSGVGHAIESATGGLFSGPVLILVVIVVIVLVVKK